VIALVLIAIAAKTFISPETTAGAQGPFAGVQFSGPGAYTFFDTRTGDLWRYYEAHSPPEWYCLGKVTGLGQPLVRRGK
jgi:hypothetical protein